MRRKVVKEIKSKKNLSEKMRKDREGGEKASKTADEEKGKGQKYS